MTTTRGGRRPMLIKVINPNTTWAMTEKIGDCARSVAAAGTMIDAVSPTMGPASIESHYDEALSVPGVLDEIAKGERDGVDGYVLACFGDPGLDAARELAGRAGGRHRRGRDEGGHLSRPRILRGDHSRADRRPGLGSRGALRRQGACRNVRACEIPVLELDIPGSAGPRGDHRGMCSGRCGGRLRRHRSRLCRDGRPGQPTSAGGSACRSSTGLPPRPRWCSRWCRWA